MSFKNQELIEYLQQFAPDSKTAFIVANPNKKVRKAYPVKEVFVMQKDKDNDQPVFLIEVGEGEPLEEIEK